VLGVSFGELVLIGIVALVVVGPRRLPEMLGNLGRFIGRLRNMTTEVRRQTGIDDILRQEGIQGGLAELRGIVRGDLSSLHRPSPAATPLAPDAVVDNYGDAVDFDRWREYPTEGPDSYGAIPEDLVPEPTPNPAPTESAAATTDAATPQGTAPATGS
jgi:sec-independent protein translocase protein TatB